MVSVQALAVSGLQLAVCSYGAIWTRTPNGTYATHETYGTVYRWRGAFNRKLQIDNR